MNSLNKSRKISPKTISAIVGYVKGGTRLKQTIIWNMISPLLKINKHEMQCGFLVQGFLVRALSKFQKLGKSC